MHKLLQLLCATALVVPTVAWAGPPYLTDDPEPTDHGKWEIYGPQFEASGKGAVFEGAAGVEVNFGAAKDLQVTVGIPAAYTHDRSGWSWGGGDLEVSAKYRFYNNEMARLQIAFFPGVTLPTASHGMGNKEVTALLPIWAQKDAGHWSIFGGGGYAINPGQGNRNYWTGGVAVTREISQELSLGFEANHQGADLIGGNGSTSVGIGATWQHKAPFRLLASAGPTFEDGDRKAGFHSFVALGIDF